MNNEIKLKNGVVVKLIDKDITGEQHMDVKKTYVATTKKEIVAKGIKYYQDKLNSVVMDKPEVESIDITPIMSGPMTEVPPVVEEAVSSQLSEVDNTIPNAVEETKDEMPTVEEITKQAPLYTEEPVKAEIEKRCNNSTDNKFDIIGIPIKIKIITGIPTQNRVFHDTLIFNSKIKQIAINPDLEPVNTTYHKMDAQYTNITILLNKLHSEPIKLFITSPNETSIKAAK